MKKVLSIVLALVLCFAFVGCGQQEEPPVAEAADTTTLTLEEMYELSYPASYTYETTNKETEEVTDSGEYSYTAEDGTVNDAVLLPFWATVAEETLVDSSIQDAMNYITTNYTLQDGVTGTCLYIVDPVTSQFVAASVETETETILYTFAY